MVTFEKKIRNAEMLIEKYWSKYPRCAVATSFGKDSMVLMDIARDVVPDIHFFSVMSDTEFPQTLLLRDEVLKKWNIEYEQYDYVNDKPINPADCCRSKKVEKFKEAVRGLDCWFSGIRNDEGASRGDFKEVEERDGLIKVNPILTFTEKDIWRYLAVYRVPTNTLYGDGYRSLSCLYCSEKEKDENESERAGRWKGTEFEGLECGIHTQSLK